MADEDEPQNEDASKLKVKADALGKLESEATSSQYSNRIGEEQTTVVTQSGCLGFIFGHKTTNTVFHGTVEERREQERKSKRNLSIGLSIAAVATWALIVLFVTQKPLGGGPGTQPSTAALTEEYAKLAAEWKKVALDRAEELERRSKANSERIAALTKRGDDLQAKVRRLQKQADAQRSELKPQELARYEQGRRDAKSAALIRSMSNLRQIGSMMFIIANQDIRGSISLEPENLINFGDLETDVFISPQDPPAPKVDRAKPEELKTWLTKYGSYAFPRRPATTRPTTRASTFDASLSSESITAYEKLAPHKEQIPVLFADGHVEAYPQNEVKRLVEKQTGAAALQSER